MLRKSEVEFVETSRSRSRNRAMTAIEKQKMYRIRKKAQKTIEDLTYLAEHLEERQLDQIFTDETLIPFYRAIFYNQEADKKRIRKIVLRLIAEVLGTEEFALRFIPKEAQRLIRDTSNPMDLVQGLFFASMYST
jgi:predicted NAD/FAD-binding protein